MGLFSRTPRPERWTQLWEVLAPLQGSLHPTMMSAWRASEPAGRELRKAHEQLHEAYQALNTERLAGTLRRPFNGLQEPFAYRRFLRVIDMVVLAGPDEVRRVAEDPAAVRAHDTIRALDPIEWLDDLSPGGVDAPPLAGLLGDAVRRSRGARDPYSPPPVYGPKMAGSWPSYPRESRTGVAWTLADPSLPWLGLDTESLDDGLLDAGRIDDASVLTLTPDCWEFSGMQATKRVLTAIGVPRPAALGDRGSCNVEFLSPEDSDLGLLETGGFQAVSVLTVAEYAVTNPAARIALLTHRGAQAMLGMPLQLPPQALDALTALATP